MTWFLIAMIGPILWSLVNVADQYLVKKYSTEEQGSGGLVLFSSLIGVFTAIAIGIFTSGVFNIPFLDKILLIVAGGLGIAWVILYLYTIEIEDISFIALWGAVVPVFGYIFGYIFLGETLTVLQIIGSLIVISGILLVSIDFSSIKRQIKWRGSLYMIAVDIIIATAGIIFKYITVEGNFWVSSFWEYVGLGLIGILIYIFVPKFRKEFQHMNKEGGFKIFSLNIVSEFMTIAGNLFSNFAILLAPIAMVYVVESFQPAIVLFLVVMGTKFFPKIINEKTDKAVLIPKIIAIVVIMIGTAFLFI